MVNIKKSNPTMLGGFKHYDANGQITGSSSPNVFGKVTHHDADGNEIGDSRRNMLNG